MSMGHSTSAVPLYERPGQPHTSAWTERMRACQNCENEHHALVEWNDRSLLCVTCSTIRSRNLRIAAAGHKDPLA